MNGSGKKILIAHPRLGRGGSEKRVMHAAQELCRDHDVTIATSGAVDLADLDAYYGTRLADEDVKIRQVGLPFGLENAERLSAFRNAWFARACRKIAPEYDMRISNYNILDFGLPAIQCIADFSFDDDVRRDLDGDENKSHRWWYRPSLLRRLYLSLCREIAGMSQDVWTRDRFLVTSDWSGRLMNRRFNVKARTLYPAVVEEYPEVPWQDREPSFACIGRLSEEKRVEDMIEIVRGVRGRGHPARLHVVGGPLESAYLRRIRRARSNEGDWVVFHGWAGAQEKKQMLPAVRYGLHARRNEPFGSSVADLVAAGCIPFAPDGGGQTEVVDHPDLQYTSVDDAVEKICRVMEDEATQDKLRLHLKTQRELFTIERFARTLRDILGLKPTKPSPRVRAVVAT